MMQQRLSQLHEFGLIDLLKKKLSQSQAILKGIGDDTAVISYSKTKVLLLTTDMLLEGMHFKKTTRPFDIGYKALAVNISDVAAMGGLPKYALVSIGINPKQSVQYVKSLYQGMESLAKQFGVNIVGGDTVKSSSLAINVALVGEAQKKRVVYRQGAKPGDVVFITGPLGRSFQSDWHLKFVPRVKESQYLVKNFKVTSMIDVSDGLVQDLNHLLRQSRCSAKLWKDQIPRRTNATIKAALSDGEDFELLFTVPKKDAARLKRSKKFLFYEIGEIVSAPKGIRIIDKNGKQELISAKGFQHF